MPAKELPDGSLQIKTNTGSQVFQRTFASMAWPDEAPGSLLILGVKLNGKLKALREFSGGLFELGSCAIEAKTEYLIDSVIVDSRDSISTLSLRNLDGLCFDKTIAAPSKKPLRKMRDRSTINKELLGAVSVAPASGLITDNYRGALERVRMLIMTRRIIIDGSGCPKLAHDLMQSMNIVLNSAVVKALVLASGAIADTDSDDAILGRDPASWYCNMPRKNFVTPGRFLF